jgi:hypothetical protein
MSARRHPRPVRSDPQPHPGESDVRRALDFSDAESQRVFDAAAEALVGELARQAAREHFVAVRELP